MLLFTWRVAHVCTSSLANVLTGKTVCAVQIEHKENKEHKDSLTGMNTKNQKRKSIQKVWQHGGADVGASASPKQVGGLNFQSACGTLSFE